MKSITPEQMAQAIIRQESLAGTQAWIDRCDVLFARQPVVFPELVSFHRDGVTAEQLCALVGFLSTLQFLADDVMPTAAKPVEHPEFAAAVERAVVWFSTLDKCGGADFERKMSGWFNGLARDGAPVVWAQCLHVIRSHGILQAELAQDMVITLHAVADVFSSRLGGGTPIGRKPRSTRPRDRR